MLQIVYRPLAELIENPKNPRKCTPESVKELAESIKKNPDYFEARPILLSNRTGVLMIIGGEQRCKAARLLNMEKVPTILFEGLSEEREDEIMNRDNTHAGTWDRKKLDTWQRHVLKSWGVKAEDFKIGGGQIRGRNSKGILQREQSELRIPYCPNGG